MIFFCSFTEFIDLIYVWRSLFDSSYASATTIAFAHGEFHKLNKTVPWIQFTMLMVMTSFKSLIHVGINLFAT